MILDQGEAEAFNICQAHRFRRFVLFMFLLKVYVVVQTARKILYTALEAK
jgi:hypothetical protein